MTLSLLQFDQFNRAFGILYSAGVGEAEFFIQYVLVRYLAGVMQVLPQDTDGDGDDEKQRPLCATDWRTEGVLTADSGPSKRGVSTVLFTVGDSGATGDALTSLVKDVFMTVDSRGDAMLTLMDLMVISPYNIDLYAQFSLLFELTYTCTASFDLHNKNKNRAL